MLAYIFYTFNSRCLVFKNMASSCCAGWREHTELWRSVQGSWYLFSSFPTFFSSAEWENGLLQVAAAGFSHSRAGTGLALRALFLDCSLAPQIRGESLSSVMATRAQSHQHGSRGFEFQFCPNVKPVGPPPPPRPLIRLTGPHHFQ